MRRAVVTGHYHSEVSPLMAQAERLFEDDRLVEVTQPIADHARGFLAFGEASLSQKSTP